MDYSRPSLMIDGRNKPGERSIACFRKVEVKTVLVLWPAGKAVLRIPSVNHLNEVYRLHVMQLVACLVGLPALDEAGRNGTSAVVTRPLSRDPAETVDTMQVMG